QSVKRLSSSASTRSDIEVFPDAAFKPWRAMPRTMCFTSASGCSEDRLMSLSFMLRIRSQSVLEVLEEDSRFTLCCLSKGDDVDAILRFGMDYGHRNALQQSQGHETLLVVPEAVVFKRESGTVEYPLGIHEIQSMV